MAIVLPNLGGPGFWDPDELSAVSAVGRGEWAARIGFALWALLTVALVLGAGWRLAGRRAGAIAALVLCTSPLFVLHARLATSDMPAAASVAAIAFGVCGLARRRGWWSAFDIAIAVAGTVAFIAQISGWALPLGTPRAGLAWSRCVEGVVYGAFPWTAVLLVCPGFRRTRALAAIAVGAVAVFVASTLFGSAGAVEVVPLIALGLGIALVRPRGRAPAAAVCALGLAVLVGRDLMRFPGKLAALGTGVSHELAVDHTAALLPMVFGIAFGLAAAWALLSPRRSGAMVAVAVAFGLCFAHVWIPHVSNDHSQKHLYALWREVRTDPAQPILLWRAPKRGAAEYADGDSRVVGSASQLARELAVPDRFAIAPGSALCSIRSAMVGAGSELFALAGGWNTFSLLSSSLPAGLKDRNPLTHIIERDLDPDKKALVAFADGIELIDVEMPARVRRGSRFEMILRYRVTARPRRGWRVFVHFDGPGIRFQGDHRPVHERCPPNQWMPGDVITDRFVVKAGNLAHPRGRYLVWAGFFTGTNPNWKNLEVVSGDRDGQNRAHIGSVQVW